MSFKVWVKTHKRESATSLVLFGVIASVVVYLVFFYGESENFESQRSQNTYESESSLHSSGGGDGYDFSRSPQIERSGKAAGVKDVIPNNTSNNNTDGNTNRSNSQGNLPGENVNFPTEIKKTPKPLNPLQTQNPSEHKKSADQLEKDLKNSEIIEETHDFAPILDDFKKAALTFRPPAPAPSGSTPKPITVDNQKAHLAQLFSLNPSLKPSDEDTPFEKAHKKVFDLLSNALLRGSCNSHEMQILNDAFTAAKQEAKKVIASNNKALFYEGVTIIKEYVPKSVQFGNLLRYVVNVLLTEGQSPLFEDVFELFFHSVHLLNIFVKPQDWLKPTVNLTSDYSSQREALMKQTIDLLNFRDVFAARFEVEFSKAVPDIRIVQTMVDNWKTMNVGGPAEEKDRHETLPSVSIKDVKDIGTARLFCYQQFLHKNLSNHFRTHSINIIEANRAYKEISKGLAPTSIITTKNDFGEILDGCTPAPFISPQHAVLNGKPYRCNPVSTAPYSSSILQSLTNFLPIFQSLAEFDTSGRFSKKFSLLLKLSTQDLVSADFGVHLVKNPISVFEEFCSSFPDKGFSLIRACGLARFHLYYPPLVSHSGFNLVERASQVAAIGPLFIYSLSRRPEQSFYPPEDVPLQLSMNVLGVEAKKSYQLYSVIFGMTSGITVAYVKRADGKWYDTNYQREPSEVPLSSIPLKKSSQSTSLFPLMAFYLRTEA